jgi:hypothetical protein
MCCNAMFSVSLGCLLHAADLHQDRAIWPATLLWQVLLQRRITLGAYSCNAHCVWHAAWQNLQPQSFVSSLPDSQTTDCSLPTVAVIHAPVHALKALVHLSSHHLYFQLLQMEWPSCWARYAALHWVQLVGHWHGGPPPLQPLCSACGVYIRCTTAYKCINSIWHACMCMYLKTCMDTCVLASWVLRTVIWGSIQGSRECHLLLFCANTPIQVTQQWTHVCRQHLCICMHANALHT